MKIAKRIFLFVAVNALVIATISIVLSVLGIGGFSLRGSTISWSQLAIYCGVWGMGGAFISLAISRLMAKWMMGVKIIDPDQPQSPVDAELLMRVHQLARQAGLSTMPQVGIYDSPELNAFATGPTRNRALVAVSTGLLDRMSVEQVDGVLAHEVAHIANGDMVTMTLVQGVVNAFVMFLARTIAWFAGQFVDEERRELVQFGIILVLEIGLSFLGMIVVSAFSRHREYRADAGGAKLAGADRMIAALVGLKTAHELSTQGHQELVDDGRAPALASLKISSKPGGFLRLFSTHPDLDDRIARLRQLEEIPSGGETSLRRSGSFLTN